MSDWTSGASFWDSGDTSYFSDYIPDYSTEFDTSLQAPDWSQYAQDPSLYSDIGGGSVPGTSWTPPSMATPGAAPGGAGAPGGKTSPLMGALGGAAPGLLSMLGQMIGGGKSSVSPNIPTNQRALQGQQSQALGFMQPGANQLWGTGTGLMNQLGMQQNPLQQQQASILAALSPTAANLASGNMQIPPQLRALIDQAYDPYIGEITENAINNARNRGFEGGADLLGGPAGTIAGPGLANAAGMKANSLLQAMTAMPLASAQIAGSYNQPVNQLSQIAGASMMPQQQQVQGYSNMFQNYPYGQTSQGNLGSQIGQSAGQAVAGAGQGYGLNTLLNALAENKQSAGGMSGIYS